MNEKNLRRLILGAYDTTIDIIVIGLVLTMLVLLVFAFVDVLITLLHLIPTIRGGALDEGDFRDMVTSVLDVFVIIELFSTFIDYVKERRIRITRLIDVTAVFVLREMLIKVYAKAFSTNELLVLALLLLVLVIARSVTGRFPPKSRDEV
ncbi:phosphate-starvation-inducible PsiE family protein [Dyella sp. A6]|uniref:phosphate-starvation-inducible PsiE family protein n=1 Tax=Dyella aluminiiresistens TaxID=3069105 RepID=UPI002E778C08|nr:phosphate-starvation-inducible PsiE family protein [Dyella sp. A6]